MGNVQLAITIVCLIAIALLIFLAFFHSLEVLNWITAWIRSNKEEKASLTRLKGHYNANGYLVHSDSDIQLDWGSGSFKRFDSVDRDFKITVATTSMNDWNESNCDEVNEEIPPQPLRPAPPIPVTTSTSNLEEINVCKSSTKFLSVSSYEETSISPIPRPVSSLSVAALSAQSQFPVNISPPPRTQSVPQKLTHQSALEHKDSLPQCDENESISVSSALKRAISCDSVCSDTSVALGDLESFNITGYLCIGLEYDSECWDLIVNVLEAKDLTGVPKTDDFLDTYVRVSLLPDKDATIQTRIYRSSSSPSYKERFLFGLNPREQSQRTLCFHVYATDLVSHTLIGEGEIHLGDISLRQPVTTWVSLTDTGQKGTEFGEVMFSLSYLPTAERLTVVVVKARNLKFPNNVPGDSFVKVYLMQHNKKINKKKTSVKKAEKCPIFNESMMFSVPAHTLPTIQLRVTVAETSTVAPPEGSACAVNYTTVPIGHVIVGAQATGRPLAHWSQMLAALRKPVAMWHPLRK